MLDNCDYNVEVKLLAITGVSDLDSCPSGEIAISNAEQLIEYAGRLCWDSTDRMGTNPKRIQDWIHIGHESVVEHASATFYIRASRVFTHELVRHRLASYSQRSQRHVTESDPRYIIPPELKDTSSQASQVFESAMTNAWAAYTKLLAQGIRPEIARYVLPNACETQIVMTMNYRELRHFIKLRTSEKALPEMRIIAGEILRIMKEQAPRVFEDL